MLASPSLKCYNFFLIFMHFFQIVFHSNRFLVYLLNSLKRLKKKYLHVHSTNFRLCEPADLYLLRTHPVLSMNSTKVKKGLNNQTYRGLSDVPEKRPGNLPFRDLFLSIYSCGQCCFPCNFI